MAKSHENSAIKKRRCGAVRTAPYLRRDHFRNHAAFDSLHPHAIEAPRCRGSPRIADFYRYAGQRIGAEERPLDQISREFYDTRRRTVTFQDQTAAIRANVVSTLERQTESRMAAPAIRL